MARSEWQELLGHSGAGNTSLNDVIRDIESSTSPGPTNMGGVNAGGNSSPGLQQGSNDDMTEQMSSLVSQISSLNSTQQSAITAIQGNTQAVTQNTSAKGSGSSTASQVGNIAESLFGGALSLSPILSGIMSLFSGGGSTQAPAMEPFMLPAPVQLQAGLTGTGGSAAPVSYGAGGQPRTQATSQAPQVTVQVNAMDSQSFLDHSDDIANAVRTALLNSNALGDVIADL